MGKHLMTKKQIEERTKFLDVYTDFNEWLVSLGFRRGHYWRECGTYMDISYSYYEEYVTSMHGVEHVINDTLNLSIRFLRDRYEHKFLVVGEAYTHSIVYTLEEFKELILNDCKKIKNELLDGLTSLTLV